MLGEALWAEWKSQGVDVISVIGPAIDTPNYVRTNDESAAIRDAVRMITEKLWPELGDLLDGDDEA